MSRQIDMLTDDTIAQRFHEFHERNPELYELLVRLAKRARTNRPGCTIGAKALVERARWEFSFERDEHEDYKINNDYTSRYARLIARQEPGLSDAFEFRRLRAP